MPAIEVGNELVRFSTENGIISFGGGELAFEILEAGAGRLLVRVRDEIREIIYSETSEGIMIPSARGKMSVRILSDRDLLLKGFQSEQSSSHSHSEIKAPMPGLVVKVLVNRGDTVRRGSTLAILEAMKMENEIRIAQDAEVIEVLVKSGDIVEKDQVIFRLQ
ncbi:MAG: acetyl-CoA carboxylase biotin carboxyl carrier protein subunit [Bacteroidetes bacterium]|nr:acetyl-CoA carboxylase biotin carboxyl carrier protein subunit [Bacteroidota bacterium]